MNRLLLIPALLLLASCGARERLRPAEGASLPPKPAMSPNTPTAEQLLALPAVSRPGRSDELLTKSQPRPEDRFDLPPG